MKSKYSLLFLLTSVLIGATSCSMINSFTERNNNKNNTSSIILTDDRESLHPQNKSSVYSPEELARGVVKGDWAIETVLGKKAVGETAPYLKFDTNAKMVYGSNGCNYLNASYIYNPSDSTIQFNNPVSTMRACGTPGITDYEINQALNQTRKYSWHLAGSQYFLTFYSEDGAELLTLMHQNFNFLNGTWLIGSIDDHVINSPGKISMPELRIVIDIDEEKVHGNTGCNILNGAVKTDMELPNCISFEQLITTRMSCPDSENIEADLLVALEEVYTALPVAADKVELVNANGKVVLTLFRTQDK